ncbi:MAG: hypothetical protein RBR12_11570 [Sulfurospirillum cavolei]|nr:hypothetical protein [Sulfurospirillum cavolei]
MASSGFGKFIEILFDKISTPVEVLDAYKNLYSDNNTTMEQVLNVSAGTTGLASAVAGYAAF